MPRSLKKAFDKEYSFKAWGTEVCLASGRVGGPLKRLRQIEELTVQLVSQKYTTKKAMQKLVGLYVYPFMHRRKYMSIFHHVYLYIENLPEGVPRKIPQYIVDELLTAALLLPLAAANIRWPVSIRLAATDASTAGGGRASTLTSRAFAKALYRHGEQRGEHTRLDWHDAPIPPESTMLRAPSCLVETLMKHHWVSTQSCKFQRKEHINLLELEMLKCEIKISS